MRIEPDIIRFARNLQTMQTGDGVNNFYRAGRTNPQRHNLQLYLQQMRAIEPDTLLVGEAPGHNGCARTGVPFSSEKLLREGVLGGRLFGAHNGYEITNETVKSEQTASAMWEVLAQAPKVPLLWNAFPFHPHLPGGTGTNRKPRAAELRTGVQILTEIMGLFAITRVVAVGNAADAVLCKMGLDHAKVRHPSHGGRRRFADELGELLGEERVPDGKSGAG